MSDDVKVQAPTLEPPKPAEPKPEQAGAIDYAELVSRLEKAGITEPKQLDGKLQAAQERGHLANLLGEVKGENAELKRMLMEMQANQKRQSATAGYDDPQPGSIDLGDLIKKQIRSAIDDEKKASFEMQQRAWQAWQQIQTDEDYHLVKDAWESKMRDPNFAVKLQAGAVDPVTEYRKVLRDHYKGAVRLAAETIKSLTQGVAPPKVHVEDSARVASGMRPEPTETNKTINGLREKVNRGKSLSEDEELAALQAALLGGARR